MRRAVEVICVDLSSLRIAGRSGRIHERHERWSYFAAGAPGMKTEPCRIVFTRPAVGIVRDLSVRAEPAARRTGTAHAPVVAGDSRAFHRRRAGRALAGRCVEPGAFDMLGPNSQRGAAPALHVGHLPDFIGVGGETGGNRPTAARGAGVLHEHRINIRFMGSKVVEHGPRCRAPA